MALIKVEISLDETTTITLGKRNDKGSGKLNAKKDECDQSNLKQHNCKIHKLRVNNRKDKIKTNATSKKINLN